MKKLAVLLIVSLFSFVGCMNLFLDSRVRAEMDLERIAQGYKVIGDIVVGFNGQPKNIQIAEKVFGDFGFLILDKEFLSDPDFVINVEREDLGSGNSWSYGLGYSSGQKSVARARLTISNKGIKKIIEHTTAYVYDSGYSGMYNSSYSQQSDPGEVAFRGAVTVCVGKFLDETGIPYKKVKQ